MNKSNLFQRILTCVLGIPAVLAMIFLLPQYNFIALSIFLIVLCAAGCAEMSRLVAGRYTLSAFLPVVACIAQYLKGVFGIRADIGLYCFMFSLILLFALEVKRGENTDFASSVPNLSSELLILLYPGIFILYIIRMLARETATPYSVCLFLVLVFINDIFAYIAGMLAVRRHAGIFKASPKKSIEGFAGGAVACTLYSVFCFSRFPLPPVPLYVQAITGLSIALLADIGDLAESVVKRFAKVKDSGSVFPGRGGVLDCIDSIVFAAPLFFCLLEAYSA